MSPLYKMMSEKYPEEMKRATENFENWKKPIPREEFDILCRIYNLSLKFFALESPRTAILNFFREKGIHRLYCSGYSNFGKAVVTSIENEIEIITYKTGKCSECDAVYILSTKKSDIDNIIKQLNTNKKIYTYIDIENWLNF